VRDPRIVPDMGVKVSFLESAPTPDASQRQGVRVPAAALVQRDGKDVAFVLGDGDTVRLRPVKPGRALGDDRQVLSGLAAGDTVVLDPPAALADGGKVRVADDASSQ